uniref:rRNA-processing protein EFG1 n=1 Tax=Blastobotrys adeninivorans TaxID=409370 RepID=A0A060T480_BLAAD
MGPKRNRNRNEVQSTGGGTAKIKKKIRDLNRLLRKPDLDADKRVECERALKSFQSQLEDAQYTNKVRTIAKKYHMVRFFERKKATRRLKNAIKNKQDVLKAEIDLYYTVLFPKEKPYVSLYPKEGADSSREQRQAFKDRLRAQIEEGSLPSGLDNGQSKALTYVSRIRPSKEAKHAPKEKHHDDDDDDNENDDEEEDEEEDGEGDEFFE